LYNHAVTLTILYLRKLFQVFLVSQILIVVAPAVLAAQGILIQSPSRFVLVF